MFSSICWIVKILHGIRATSYKLTLFKRSFLKLPHHPNGQHQWHLHPWTLSPSTTTNSIKLDGSHNYLAWKMQFLNLLRGQDLVGFIDGTDTCPPKNLTFGSLNSTYIVWQMKDVCLFRWILHLFWKNLFPLFMDWKRLSKSGLPYKLVFLLNLIPTFPILNLNFKH